MTSSKHTSVRRSKSPVRLTTFKEPNDRQNGCLKRDRQLVSSGPHLTMRTRKDAAVHVSLSSDEIVKQRSEETSPRPLAPPRASASAKPKSPNSLPSPSQALTQNSKRPTVFQPLLSERFQKPSIKATTNRPANPAASPSVRRI